MFVSRGKTVENSTAEFGVAAPQEVHSLGTAATSKYWKFSMSDTYYYLCLIRNSLRSPSDLFSLSMCGWADIKLKIKPVPISLSKTNAKKKSIILMVHTEDARFFPKLPQLWFSDRPDISCWLIIQQPFNTNKCNQAGTDWHTMQRRKETMQAQWDDIEQKPIQT